MQLWAGNPSQEFGFAISSDGTAAFTLGVKEGAATGYPAVLEVDIKTPAFNGTSGVFSSSLFVDTSESNFGYVGSNALTSGVVGSGEGISSKRTSGGNNQYGLDFSTGFERRMSITNGGNVGIGTLRAIEVTDYTFRDTIAKGNSRVKKVIAQQVETVFPQAINRHTDVVPDIYQKAAFEDGWITPKTDLKKGDRVRLIDDKTTEVFVREG